MEAPRHEPIPNPAIRRISLYLRQLETFARQDQKTVSSKQLGDSLGLTDAQVRKDLTHFGQFGQPGIGYSVADLVANLRSVLGTDRVRPVALVGAGNLGRALLAYRGFEARGFHLAAVFDSDVAKHDKIVAGFRVRDLGRLPKAVAEEHIELAILAVPGDAAQGVADAIIAAGIRAILNFAPVQLVAPPEVAINSVDLAVQLEQLAFQLHTSVSP
jgi:redox-sensing transcriptional repressor